MSRGCPPRYSRSTSNDSTTTTTTITAHPNPIQIQHLETNHRSPLTKIILHTIILIPSPMMMMMRTTTTTTAMTSRHNIHRLPHILHRPLSRLGHLLCHITRFLLLGWSKHLFQFLRRGLFDWQAGIFILNIPPRIFLLIVIAAPYGCGTTTTIRSGRTIINTDTPVELIVAEGGPNVRFNGGECYTIIFSGEVKGIVSAVGGIIFGGGGEFVGDLIED
mmetsp:Transcript_24035/g.36408  ORF Transcript_24035/g.36408 Transcript_24035/m.36408 type:complete len:219 (+) Transcript_24035:1062-1718(+)